MLNNFVLKKIMIIAIVFLLVPIIGISQSTQQMTFGAQSPTGGYMILATGVAKIINENVESVNITPVPDPVGSVSNVRAIDAREREFGMCKAEMIPHALKGTTPFNKKMDVNGWFNAHFAVCYVFATEKSGIKTYKDFEGKRVAVGPPGSDDLFMNTNYYLPLAGVDVSKVALEKTPLATAIDLMKDGHIDAMMFSAAPNLGMVQDLSSSREVRYIPIDEDALNKLVEEVPGFYIREYTKDSFLKEINANAIIDEASIKLWAMPHIALVSPDVDEDLMYQFTKILFENIQDIYDISSTYKAITLENAIHGMAVPVHPGAMRYYEEMGITN